MYWYQYKDNFKFENLHFTSQEDRGIIMKKNILIKTTILLSLCFTVALGQEQTDAIEKARQAKEAAEKAAAEAAAATEAAIEAAGGEAVTL